MSIQDTPKLSWWNRLAHPGQFVSWTRPLIWPLAAITAVLFALGLWFAFFNSPADYQMGDTVRIMYVHVPTAWLSQFVYGAMAVSALGTLVWRQGVAIRHPDGAAGTPRYLFQLVPEAKTVKNRMHLDVRVGADDVAAVVAGLVARGATHLHDGRQGPHTWVTLADPEGNEFCVSH